MNRDPEDPDRRTQAALWGARHGLEPREMATMTAHLAEQELAWLEMASEHPASTVATITVALCASLSAARADLAEQHKKRRELECGIEDMEHNCSAARAENRGLEVEANKLALQVTAVCDTRGELRAENERLRARLDRIWSTGAYVEEMGLLVALDSSDESERSRADVVQGAIREMSERSAAVGRVRALIESKPGVPIIDAGGGRAGDPEARGWNRAMNSVRAALAPALAAPASPVECSCTFKDDPYKAPERHSGSCPVWQETVATAPAEGEAKS